MGERKGGGVGGRDGQEAIGRLKHSFELKSYAVP